MPKPASFIHHLSLTLAARGEASAAELADACQKSRRQIYDALSAIAKKGGAAYERERNVWRHIVVVGERPDAVHSTVEQRNIVYRACDGKVSKRDIEEITGLPAAIVARALKTLAARRRVHHTAFGWAQAAALPNEMAPNAALSITAEDVAWHRYWSPANREQRRQDRAIHG